MKEDVKEDLKVAMVKLGMLLLDLFVFLIVFKCGVDSGGNYYLFLYPAAGWILGTFMAEWYGYPRERNN